jgi:hypothetical protein
MRFEDSVSVFCVSRLVVRTGFMEGRCSFTFAIGVAFGKRASEDTLATVYELFAPG